MLDDFRQSCGSGSLLIHNKLSVDLPFALGARRAFALRVTVARNVVVRLLLLNDVRDEARCRE